MMTVEQIMEHLGGFKKIAKVTGFPVTTVHSWKRNEFIPTWRRPALLEMAAKMGNPLSEADFPPPVAKPSRKAA